MSSPTPVLPGRRNSGLHYGLVFPREMPLEGDEDVTLNRSQNVGQAKKKKKKRNPDLDVPHPDMSEF